jgi:hypothetical protein
LTITSTGSVTTTASGDAIDAPSGTAWQINWWTPQLGGKRAYRGRLGKDRSLGESRHSSAS